MATKMAKSCCCTRGLWGREEKPSFRPHKMGKWNGKWACLSASEFGERLQGEKSLEAYIVIPQSSRGQKLERYLCLRQGENGELKRNKIFFPAAQAKGGAMEM